MQKAPKRLRAIKVPILEQAPVSSQDLFEIKTWNDSRTIELAEAQMAGPIEPHQIELLKLHQICRRFVNMIERAVDSALQELDGKTNRQKYQAGDQILQVLDQERPQ